MEQEIIRKTLFISDCHLDPNTPEVNDYFFAFLEDTAPSADALYILGDLFEVWIGDDENLPLHHLVADKLSQLPCSVFFLSGNRDFLLGNRYAKKAKMTLIEDPQKINLYGKPALVLHGDTLCTDDIKYQTFRKKARSSFFQSLFKTLPLFVRRKIANAMRSKSRTHTQITPLAIMDVNTATVEKCAQENQVDLLIHGHTHRPAIHSEASFTRIVLPSWHDGGGYLEYFENHVYHLKNNPNSLSIVP